MDILEKIVDGALSEIGAVVVGAVVSVAMIAFGLKKKRASNIFHQKQKAGDNSKQIMKLSSNGNVDAEQEAGNSSIQVQEMEDRDAR